MVIAFFQSKELFKTFIRHEKKDLPPKANNPGLQQLQSCVFDVFHIVVVEFWTAPLCRILLSQAHWAHERERPVSAHAEPSQSDEATFLRFFSSSNFSLCLRSSQTQAQTVFNMAGIISSAQDLLLSAGKQPSNLKLNKQPR